MGDYRTHRSFKHCLAYGLIEYAYLQHLSRILFLLNSSLGIEIYRHGFQLSIIVNRVLTNILEEAFSSDLIVFTFSMLIDSVGFIYTLSFSKVYNNVGVSTHHRLLLVNHSYSLQTFLYFDSFDSQPSFIISSLLIEVSLFLNILSIYKL